MARVLLVDPFSGAAGDMFLGGLIGLGVSLEDLRSGLQTVPIGGWRLETETVSRCGLAAVKLRVLLDALQGGEERRGADSHGHHGHAQVGGHGRTPEAILRLIRESGLPEPAKHFAAKTFTLRRTAR